MPTYTVKKGSGPHREGGRTFKAGETFQSPHPLHTIFPGKFEAVDGTENVAEREANARTTTPYDTPETKTQPASPVFQPTEPGPVEQSPDFDVDVEEEEPGDEDGPKTRTTTRKAASSSHHTTRSRR